MDRSSHAKGREWGQRHFLVLLLLLFLLTLNVSEYPYEYISSNFLSDSEVPVA